MENSIVVTGNLPAGKALMLHNARTDSPIVELGVPLRFNVHYGRGGLPQLRLIPADKVRELVAANRVYLDLRKADREERKLGPNDETEGDQVRAAYDRFHDLATPLGEQGIRCGRYTHGLRQAPDAVPFYAVRWNYEVSFEGGKCTAAIKNAEYFDKSGKPVPGPEVTPATKAWEFPFGASLPDLPLPMIGGPRVRIHATLPQGKSLVIHRQQEGDRALVVLEPDRIVALPELVDLGGIGPNIWMVSSAEARTLAGEAQRLVVASNDAAGEAWAGEDPDSAEVRKLSAATIANEKASVRLAESGVRCKVRPGPELAPPRPPLETERPLVDIEATVEGGECTVTLSKLDNVDEPTTRPESFRGKAAPAPAPAASAAAPVGATASAAPPPTAAPTPSRPTTTSHSAGCGACSVGREGGGRGGFALVLATAALGLRRRRRAPEPRS